MSDPVNIHELGRMKRSACCAANVHAENGDPDFAVAADGSGEHGAAVTCWFVCDACNEPCDLVDAIR